MPAHTEAGYPMEATTIDEEAAQMALAYLKASLADGWSEESRLCLESARKFGVSEQEIQELLRR